tara:strand:- start:1239 stop:1553 length:315 start_codon:yes stop_codon:yes gene_type:complete
MIVIYHNQKILSKKNITPTKGLEAGSKLILDGIKEGYSLEKQIDIYLSVINTYQTKRIYNLTSDDKKYYISCILALWKLDIFDPYHPTDPLYIAPFLKKNKKIV